MGYIVRRLRRIPLIGERTYRVAVAICGYLTGHQPGADWGHWINGDGVDVWCRWCDKFQQIAAKDADPEVRAKIFKMTGNDIWNQKP